MKTCKTCKVEKELSEFHKRSDAKDGLQRICKQCNIERVVKWQGEHPKYYLGRDLRLDKRRAKKYGITVDQLHELLESANGVCEICHREPNRFLVIDHCHKFGNVRGVLCEKCNQALGLIEDKTEYLESMIEYLSKPLGLDG